MNINFSDIFEKNAGQLVGITVWEIENFLPNPLEEAFHGHFYEGWYIHPLDRELLIQLLKV